VRAERSREAAEGALTRVEEAARKGENLLPPMIAAVEAYATLGEIADRLRIVFGEFTEAI
jgi:methylmalonyl-CoA mutase N-terminal domain/subunit